MKRIAMIMVAGFMAMGGYAHACGYDPCDPNSGCSDYFIPCKTPLYIDPVYGPRSNFRLLVSAYAPLKEPAAPKFRFTEEREEFGRYQQRIKQLLEQKSLAPVSLQHVSVYLYGAHPCLSNNFENALSFIETAANDPGASPFLRDAVIDRDAILHVCAKPGAEMKANLETSLGELGRQKGAGDYAKYLKALSAFYSNDYRKAIDHFQSLDSASNPWIRETALYLIGRSYLVLAQEKWSGWDKLDAIDKESLNRAEAAYRKYLSVYPVGQYAASARNIPRRIMFLRQDTGLLNTEIEHLFEAALEERNEDRLLQATNEALNFYSAAKISFGSPLLTAYQLFQGAVPGPDVLGYFRTNANQYKKYPGLQAFLISETLFLQKKYQEVIDLPVPPKDKAPEAVGMALRTLRAEAYEQLGKYTEARKIWKQAAELADPADYPHFFQMALAHNYLKDDKIDLIALNGSGVTEDNLLREIFETLATDSLLERLVLSPKTLEKARPLAQTTLLNRYVLQGRYPDLLRMLKQVKEPGIYDQIETAARTLLKNEKDPKGLLNAGYFIYYNGIHPAACWKSGFAAKYRSRYKLDPDPASLKPPIDYFTTALAQFGENERSEVEAKLLHYAIMSFKPSNKAMDSTWGRRHEDGHQGKEWYDRLHRKYPDSEWAEKTKYYYNGR
jgi:TolA-binding protein